MITNEQKDVLREIINIGVGKAANLLNTIVNKHIKLEVPDIKLLELKNVQNEFNTIDNDLFSSITMKFTGEISGTANLLFSSMDASLLVNTFVQRNDIGEDIDALKSGVLNEIGNIVLNSLVGTLANFIKQNLDYNVPLYSEGKLNNIFNLNDEQFSNSIIIAHTRFKIDELNVLGDFMLLLEVGSLDKLLELATLSENDFFV